MCERLNELEERMQHVMNALSTSRFPSCRCHTATQPPTSQPHLQKVPEPMPLSSSQGAPALSRGPTSAPSQPTMATVVSQLEDGDFTEVKRRGHRKRTGRKKSKARMQGSAECSEILVGGSSTFKLVTTNVNPKIKAEEVKEYIQKKAPEVKVHDVEDASST